MTDAHVISTLRARRLGLAQHIADTEKKLAKLIKKWGGTPSFHLRNLKCGHSKGFKWEVDDANGRLRILNTKKTKAA